MKPMKAEDAKELVFPLYASPKLDGIRAVVKDATVLSNSLKLIPNAYVQQVLGQTLYDGLDGELVVGPPNAPNAMQSTTSGVMSRTGEPDFTYWVFDFWNSPSMPFSKRYQIIMRAVRDGIFDGPTRIQHLPQTIIRNEIELNAFETMCLEDGYEGIMVRSPSGIYKYGRSTAREGIMLKVKRWADGEAIVIGYEEQMHNANEASVNALGNTQRSTAKAGMVPKGTLGTLLVKELTTGVEFSVGTGKGLTAELRQKLWEDQDNLIGKTIKYQSFKATGVKEKPRFPKFVAFRDPIDME